MKLKPKPSCYLYSTTPSRLEKKYHPVVDACRAQGITHVIMLAGVTGKLTAPPEKIGELKIRLEADGLKVQAMIFGIGHPGMERAYDQAGNPPAVYPFYDGPLVFPGQNSEYREMALLPRGWQYAVNERGNPVFYSACPNAACTAGNQAVLRAIAPLFETIWYDDEYRMDGDQYALTPLSTACCYCDACLAELSGRLGQKVARTDIVKSQKLHTAWIDYKCDKLAALWRTLQKTGQQANPALSLGLMVRWGGEERDGIDLDRLLPSFGQAINLRLGEGHFQVHDYRPPSGQAIEYLAASYHAGWFPPEIPVLSETTYFKGVTREMILKKIVLALAAGARDIAYCPCVSGYVEYQNFLEKDKGLIAGWQQALADKTALYRPVAIMRGQAAASGNSDPAKRVRDRRPFPLFSLAGLCATVVRQRGWRDHGQYDVVAVTGRAVWDCQPADYQGKTLVLDGAALLENSPFNDHFGIYDTKVAAKGRVDFKGDFSEDGALVHNENLVVIPYIWQDVPDEMLPGLLEDIRRVLAPRLRSVVVNGDLNVLPVHFRYPDKDVILLVNLAETPADISLYLPRDRPRLVSLEGSPASGQMALGPDEILLLAAV